MSNLTHPEDQPQEDLKIRLLFRLLFKVYKRQTALADRLEDVIVGLEAAGVFLRQSHTKAVIQDYLTRQVEAERRKMQRRF